MKKNKKETRATRYSKKNRIKKQLKELGLKGISESILIFIIKYTIYFVVGFAYAIYLAIRAFDDLVVKLFMKLPRLMKVTIMYLMIINLSLDVYDLSIPFKQFVESYTNGNIVSVVTSTVVTPKDAPKLAETPQNEVKQEKVKECYLQHETACKIKNKAEQYGIDWKIAVSISKWETGNFTSNLYLNKNNVGGLYCNGSFLKYATLDEGVEAYVSNLKRLYFDMGLNTLEKIQPKYCPIGADNDPNNLNRNWLGGVTKIYNSLEK